MLDISKIKSIKIVISQFIVRDLVFKDMISNHNNRMPHGHSCFFLSTMTNHAMVECIEIGLFRPRNCPGRFCNFSLQLTVSLINLATLRFASIFVVCKTKSSLRSQIPMEQKTTHVNSDLSNDGLICTFTARFFYLNEDRLDPFLLFKNFCPGAVLLPRNSDENTEAAVGNQQLI